MATNIVCQWIVNVLNAVVKTTSRCTIKNNIIGTRFNDNVYR